MLFRLASLFLSWVASSDAAVTVKTANFSVQTEIENNATYCAALNETTTALTTGFVDPGIGLVKFLDIGQANAENATDTNTSYLAFDVTSDQSFSGQSNVAVVIDVRSSSSSGTYPAPIAYSSAADAASLSRCTGINCFESVSLSIPPSGGGATGALNYYSAAIYNVGKALRVGIYPKDIGYRSFNNVSQFTSGTVMYLKFHVRVTNGVTSAATGTDDVSSEIAVTLTSAPPTFTCNNSIIYSPGDSSIFFNSNSVSGSPGTSGAPIHSAVMVAQSGSAPFFDHTSYSAMRTGTIVSTPEINTGNVLVSGFDNSTLYGMSVSVRDWAGWITDFTSDNSCNSASAYAVSGPIAGFTGSTKCFIATAAYGSVGAWPVQVLREFRSQILHSTHWGRRLSQAYYEWAPAPAQWIEGRVVAKWAVSIALLPIVVLAWLTLHPLAFALVASGSAVFLFSRWAIWRRSSR